MQYDLFAQEVEEFYELRPYQEEAVNAILDSYKRGVNPLLIMATGTGKTQVFSSVIHETGDKSLVLAHRETLIDQAIEKISRITGRRPQKEKANAWAEKNSEIVVASVQSMQNSRMERFPKDYFGFLTTDEAHHAPAKSYRNIYNYFDSAVHLGVTATPDRADTKKLGTIYDEIAYEYSLLQAIKDKYLAPIKGYKVKDFTIDLNGLKIYAGDYSDGELGKLIEDYIAPIAKSIEEQSAWMKTMVFMPTVESSRLMCDALRSLSIDAGYVAGNTDNQKQVLYDFHVGNISHLVSCDMLLEGYDEPSVEAIVMLRPTGSRTVYTQIVGRGTRLFPGKESLKLIEFTYNSDRLKLVTPYELFTSKENTERVRQEAEGLAENMDEIDYLSMIEEAKDRFYNISNIMNRMIIPGYGFTEFDPLALGDALDVDITGEYNLQYKGHKVEGPVTMKQMQLLERYGVKKFSDIDRAQASMLISKLFENGYRPLTGEATPKQKSFLQRHGIESSRLMKAQASMLIDKIKKANEDSQAQRVMQSIDF